MATTKAPFGWLTCSLAENAPHLSSPPPATGAACPAAAAATATGGATITTAGAGCLCVLNSRCLQRERGGGEGG